MKYIIMCGGIYPQFKKPRQLTEVFGEKLVERTIRLLRENGVDDIAISTTSDAFNSFGVPILQHDNKYHYTVNTDWLDGFYPMDEPVCYIFGDVYFSPQAIKTIVEYKVDDVMFFASGPYAFHIAYIKDWSEPFAFKVVDTEKFREAIRKTNELESLFRRKPIAWELWQVIKGHPLNVIRYDSYVAINDYTCDVDNAYDLEKIEAKMIGE